MANIKPNGIPKMNREELIALINKHYPNYFKDHWAEDKFAHVWVRGYYKKTMGDPAKNDRAIYDDAAFIITDTNFHAYNANTDPSRYKPGIASLVPGVYRGVYKFDMHHGSKGSYPAVCQRLGPVVVIRDGKKVNDPPQMIGINQHRGGFRTTSSLGCLTTPPDQYERWYLTGKRLFTEIHDKEWDKASPTMILIEL